jgi:hypothetical protein
MSKRIIAVCERALPTTVNNIQYTESQSYSGDQPLVHRAANLPCTGANHGGDGQAAWLKAAVQLDRVLGRTLEKSGISLKADQTEVDRQQH